MALGLSVKHVMSEWLDLVELCRSVEKMTISRKKKRKDRGKPITLRIIEPRPVRMTISPYVLQKRVRALAECIRLYPDEVAEGLAKRDEAGWCFGQLYLIGAIDMIQYSAAKQLDQIVRRYKRLLHRHGLVEARDIERAMLTGSGSSGEDLSDQAIKTAERIYDDYKVSHDKLTSAGRHVREAMFSALEKDRVSDLTLIRIGLDALSSGKSQKAG